MKIKLLMISKLAVIILGVYFVWECSHVPKNLGSTRGYWGEFNTISNVLAKLPGVTIVKPWYNADITLEEFGFDILAQGQEVHLGFGERDLVRKLSGRNLEKALLELIKKQSSSSAAALDGGSPVLFAFLAHWPASSEPHCWAL
jgi:hypothetical protein